MAVHDDMVDVTIQLPGKIIEILGISRNKETTSTLIQSIITEYMDNALKKAQAIRPIPVPEGFERFIFEFKSPNCSGMLTLISEPELRESFKKETTWFQAENKQLGYSCKFDLEALEHYSIRREN